MPTTMALILISRCITTNTSMGSHIFPNFCYFVAEPPKCLGPPTPVIVLRTSDGDAGDPPTLEVR